MNIWVVLILTGLLTYGIRLSFIKLFEHMEITPGLKRALSLVPPAVLSAIIFPEVLAHDGFLDLSLGNERMIAGLAAALVAWRTRSALLTIVAGMAALVVLLLTMK
jgi:branched-subunit amino acid transport protein